MGVHGLWKLLEPAGKPVPVETLENKVLAVDVSIWLHQLVKGFQDSSGSSLPNAHLLGLYHRVCKLLFFKIKPVFVFDGGVPVLKRRTMTARQNQKSKSEQAAEKLREQLLKNLLKQKAVGQVLEEIRGEKSSPKKQADMFELPAIAEEENPDSDLEDALSSSSEEKVKPMRYRDLHSIDVNCREFKSLPADIRHDILSELKETRKQNSWGRLHEMPEESSDFSTFQMNRLLKRRSVQVSLEEAEKEMGGRTLSLGDVETMLKEGGVDVSADIGKRIASDTTTRYLYINNIDGKNTSNKVPLINEENKPFKEEKNSSGSEIDYNELEEVEEIYVDSDSSDCIQDNLKTAKQYLTENSGLSQEELLAVIKEQSKSSKSRDIDFNEPSTSKGKMLDDLLGEGEVFNSEEKDLKSEVFGKESDVSKNRKESKRVEDFIKKEKIEVNVATEALSETILKVEKNQNENFKSVSIKEGIFLDKNKPLIIKKDEASDGSKSISKPKNNVPISKVRADILKSLNVQLKELSKPEVQNKIELNPSVLNLKDVDKSKIENVPTTDYVDKMEVENVPQNDSVGIKVEKTDSIENTFESISVDSVDIIRVKSDGAVDSVVKEKSTATDSVGKMEIDQTLFNTKDQPEVMSSSDSDSDLVDVISTNSLSPEPTVQQQNLPILEVQIEPKDVCEDDIFADIFEGNVENQNCTENKYNTKSTVEEGMDFSTDLEGVQEDESIKTGKMISEDQFDVEQVPFIENKTPVEGYESEVVKAPYFENGQSGKRIDDNQREGTSSNQEQEEKSKPKLTSKELLKLQNILESQEEVLLAERGKEERTAATITEQMYVEAQELLQLFGVPYVVAPMEAEAQCAFLDSMGLTQGTITDDSDIWLFGGRKVYKNFFSQDKYVLQFQSNDIQQFFKLARTQLVLLALLVGSDYTVGIQGVGPVTGLEILASFPPPSSADGTDIALLLSSLERFKQWLKSPPTTALGKKLKNVQLQPGFPSQEVVKAYLNPTVDDSTETFSWGTPNLDALRDFASQKFGWNKTRSDSVLLPVMKKLAEKNNQRTLEGYFQSMPNIPAHREQMSARVQRAVHRIGGGNDEIEPVVSRRRTATGSNRSRGRGRRNEEDVTRGNVRERSEFEPPPSPPVGPTYNDELIPQREQDRLDALKRKMKAIEVMKSSKRGRGGKKRRNIREAKPEAKLSESSSEDEKVT